MTYCEKPCFTGLLLYILVAGLVRRIVRIPKDMIFYEKLLDFSNYPKIYITNCTYCSHQLINTGKQ
jgi:hypothetical protein